jgi:hypothetical protein
MRHHEHSQKGPKVTRRRTLSYSLLAGAAILGLSIRAPQGVLVVMLPLMMVLPGWGVLAILFGGKSLDDLSRWVLAIASSVALIIMMALLLNGLAIRLSQSSLVITLAALLATEALIVEIQVRRPGSARASGRLPSKVREEKPRCRVRAAIIPWVLGALCFAGMIGAVAATRATAPVRLEPPFVSIALAGNLTKTESPKGASSAEFVQRVRVSGSGRLVGRVTASVAHTVVGEAIVSSDESAIDVSLILRLPELKTCVHPVSIELEAAGFAPVRVNRWISGKSGTLCARPTS